MPLLAYTELDVGLIIQGLQQTSSAVARRVYTATNWTSEMYVECLANMYAEPQALQLA